MSDTDIKEVKLEERVPDRVRIYWYPDTYGELRWECLDEEGITLFDSGSGGRTYESDENDDQMLIDIKKICGEDIRIVDERL